MSDEEAGKGEGGGETEEGALCDVAPTVLDIMVWCYIPILLEANALR